MNFDRKILLVFLIILNVNCIRKNEEKEKSEIRSNHDSIPVECRNCLNEIIKSNDELKAYFDYLKEKGWTPSTGILFDTCYNVFMKELKKNKTIIQSLFDELRRKENGKFSRSVIVQNIELLTAHRVLLITQHGDQAILENDSLEEVVISKWEKWWAENKTNSPFNWYVNALNSKDDYSITTAISNLKTLSDTNAISYLIKMIPSDGLVENKHFKAIEALAELGSEFAIPFLVEYYLKDNTVKLRETGINYLYTLTGKKFDFSSDTTKVARDKSIKKWELWLQSGEFKDENK